MICIDLKLGRAPRIAQGVRRLEERRARLSGLRCCSASLESVVPTELGTTRRAGELLIDLIEVVERQT